MLVGLFFVGVGEEQDNVATPYDGYSYRESCHPHREYAIRQALLGILRKVRRIFARSVLKILCLSRTA